MGIRENQFRTASVGGFVKKEVLEYIGELEDDYRAKLSSLERILSAAQASRSEAEARLKSIEGQHGANQEELQFLRQQVGELQNQLDELKVQYKEKEDSLVQALAEVERLRDSTQLGDGEALAAAQLEIQTLRGRLAELEKNGAGGASVKEVSELRERLKTADSMLPLLQRENLQLRAALEQGTETDNSELQAVLDQRDREMRLLQEEAAGLRAKLSMYDGAAADLEAAQARALEIESRARDEAAKIVGEAHMEAGKVRTEMDEWLCEMNETYDRIKREAAESVARASQELDRTRFALDRLTGGVQGQTGPGLPQPALRIFDGRIERDGADGHRKTM